MKANRGISVDMKARRNDNGEYFKSRTECIKARRAYRLTATFRFSCVELCSVICCDNSGRSRRRVESSRGLAANISNNEWDPRRDSNSEWAESSSDQLPDPV